MTERRWLSILCVALLVLSACSRGGDDDGDDVGSSEDDSSEAALPRPSGPVRVEAARDLVTVDDVELASGSFVEAEPGAVVTADATGSALITVPALVEIEALRFGTVTVPDTSAATLEVPFAGGHVFVRLDPSADVELTVDTGVRQFITRSPDASFALCNDPEAGASCLAVLEGEVEWVEDGVAAETYSAGEATFAGRGAAPEPPRCGTDDNYDAMEVQLASQDFAGALADIVDTWEECPEGGADADAPAEVALPSAARMEHVSLAEATIGSPDVEADTENVIAARPVEGGAEYYIEPLTVTNGEFRTWLVTAAGDDASLWEQYAPADWQERAPGGAVTQSTFADGTGDDAIQGVNYSTAELFCEAQAKRLPTEVEWELATVNGVIEDLVDDAQDWVSDWQDYGPGPEDAGNRQVLRGANATLNADPYYRVFSVTDEDATAARQHARIRCAADEVALGGQAFSTELVRDDFNSLSWPEIDVDPFELGYHPENYHLDLSDQHVEGAIVRALDEGLTAGRFDADLFIERNNTSSETGEYRFGILIGSPAGAHTLTVQPDEFAGNRFIACLMPVDEALLAELALDEEPLSADDPGREAWVAHPEQHYGEHCDDAAEKMDVPVATVDSPVRLSLVLTGGSLEAWVNNTLVASSDEVTSIETYGFFSQTYHRPRTHIHYDDLIISA